MFGNFSFFNTINAYINKNLALRWLSFPYIKTKAEEEIFSKTLYLDKNGKKKALAASDFFKVDENVIETSTRFRIPNPHFCTNVGLYYEDFEADLLLPFFNSKNLGESVALLIQKEVFYLDEEKINIFIDQEKDKGGVSFYSLFMFLVNLYCFEEEPLVRLRKTFETFLASKDFTEPFGYFVVSFKNNLEKIKPFFEKLYAENYIDCNYSKAIINSNEKIALQIKINYSAKVSLDYQMKMPAGKGLAAGARGVPIEFLLTQASGEEVFKAGVNSIVPCAVEFVGGKARPEFKYAKRFPEEGETEEHWTARSHMKGFERAMPYKLRYNRERLQAIFCKNLNSRAFANQIKSYGKMTESFVENNIAAIQARKFIVEISKDLLKDVLLISSLS